MGYAESFLAIAIVLGSTPARASSLESRLEVFDREAVAITRVVADLRDQVQPTSPLTPDQAARRLDEAVFLNMVGEFEQAASSLYTVVSTGALEDVALQRDAEWTYAEALYAMGNVDGAAQRFEAIVADRNHPFHAEAVRNLLELYAETGQTAAFRAVHAAEIASGRVEPTGRITYALAKGYYRQGDLAAADEAFAQVAPADPWAARAQYFRGVVATRQGALAEAITHFEGVADAAWTEPIDHQVHDRALMALGRLHYHAGDYGQASARYAQVSTDGELLDDKLYEMIWTSIRQERWADALHNVEVFLMAFPDHEYAAQLLLLRGHLHVQDEAWDDALSAYERVIREYGPVHDRFEALASPGRAGEVEAREVTEGIDGASGLPAYAVSMIREDPLLVRAMTVFQDLEAQRRSLDAAERLIEDLSVFLTGRGLGSFTSLRVEAVHQRAQIVQQRLGLLGLQEQWLIEQPGVDPQTIIDLRGERDALEARVAAPLQTIEACRATMDRYEVVIGARRAEAQRARERLDAMSDELSLLTTRLGLQAEAQGEPDPTLQDAVAELTRRIAEHRDTLAGLETAIVSLPVPDDIDRIDPQSLDAAERAIDALAAKQAGLWPAEESAQLLLARIDTTQEVLRTGYTDLGAVLASVASVADSEVGELRGRFESAVAEVRSQREAYVGALEEARSVSRTLTRHGFGRLSDFFADSMRRADMGIVDVWWARKLEQSDAIDRIKADQEARNAELDRRFELIRSKLGDRP